MIRSQFAQYIQRSFKAILLTLTNTINGKEGQEAYLYKSMLTKRFAPNMRWENLSIEGRAVMADVVALDSRLPLKRRASISKATGDIPKLGTKRSLNETQMNDIMMLRAMPGDQTMEIERIIFGDTVAVTRGIWERLEYMFLQGLSNDGVYGTSTADNVGQEIKVDLMQPDDNKYGVTTPWSDPTARPIDDIIRVMKQARTRGTVLRFIHMDDSTFTALLTNLQVKRQLAAASGYGSVSDSGLADAMPEQLRNMFRTQYNLTINVVDRSFIFEKDGEDTVVNGWTENKVVFTPSMNVGNLVHTMLPAEMNPNKAVDYGKVDDYILIAIYQVLDDTPLEFTTSQARVLPVINMSNIYSLNTEEAETGEQTEGDETVTLYGETDVLKSNVINALSRLGVNVAENITDAALIKKVNGLSKAKEDALKFALEIPIVSAGTDKSVTTTSTSLDGTVTPASGKTIASTVWTKVSGPAGGTIADASAVDTTVSALQDGVYVYKLTVTDSSGTVASDSISITVDIP